MRSSIALTLALCLGGTSGIVAGEPAGNRRETARALEKSIMSRGGNPPAPVRGERTDSIIDTLDLASPTWDRIFSDQVGQVCAAGSTPSFPGQGVPYAAFQIAVTAKEVLTANIVAVGTTIEDTVMAVYCDPFDPDTPQANLVAYDDDGGGGQHACFTPIDGITLDPGDIYWIVVSTFGQGDFGTFRLELTSATVQVVPVELQSFTID